MPRAGFQAHLQPAHAIMLLFSILAFLHLNGYRQHIAMYVRFCFILCGCFCLSGP